MTKFRICDVDEGKIVGSLHTASSGFVGLQFPIKSDYYKEFNKIIREFLENNELVIINELYSSTQHNRTLKKDKNFDVYRKKKLNGKKVIFERID